MREIYLSIGQKRILILVALVVCALALGGYLLLAD